MSVRIWKNTQQLFEHQLVTATITLSDDGTLKFDAHFSNGQHFHPAHLTSQITFLDGGGEQMLIIAMSTSLGATFWKKTKTRDLTRSLELGADFAASVATVRSTVLGLKLEKENMLYLKIEDGKFKLDIKDFPKLPPYVPNFPPNSGTEDMPRHYPKKGAKKTIPVNPGNKPGEYPP
jgi:hypothetical protein